MPRKLSIDGSATHAGTKAFAGRSNRQHGVPSTHFRVFDGLVLTSLGMGTYLGEPDLETDLLVSKAVEESVKSGAINVIDTAINYRLQKAERAIGKTLRKIVEEGSAKRSEIFLSTKNGYLTHDGDLNMEFWRYVHENLVKSGVIKPEEISSGMHCMSANFLKEQLDRSLRNLGVECVDLMYIHNAAESQIPDIGREEFLSKLQAAFEFYEDMRREGKIKYYGMATWTCFRAPPDDTGYLGLKDMISIAKRTGGENHGFKFIQLPFNLAMREAFLLKNQFLNSERISTLEAAVRLGVGVFTSVPLMQGRLLNPTMLPNIISTDKPALRCLQIVRSAPGVISPLVGQKDPAHVQENLQIAKLPPLTYSEFTGLITGLGVR